jgi:uncharacterized pyridoxamine 5'-phosphate oxidase family protein
MEKILNYLQQNPNVSFATVDGNKNPQSRIFQIAAIQDKKIYFFTSNKKSVFQQIKANCNIAFSNFEKGQAVRVNGKVTILTDTKLKEEILNKNPAIKAIYKTSSNPTLELIAISPTSAEMGDYTQNPPKIEKF